MMKIALIALLACAALISFISADMNVDATVSFRLPGPDTKRSIFSSTDSNGATTIMVTRRTNVNGQVSFVRHFYRVSESPVLRVIVRKTNGTFDLNDQTISNIDVTRNTHALWLGKMVLYSETNGIDGFQLNDTLIQLVDLSSLATTLGWKWASTVTSFTTSDGIEVHNITKCATSLVAGEVCFYFHTGNGTYGWHGSNVYAGTMKIDMSFMPSTTLQAFVTGPTRVSLIAHHRTSEDVINNGTIVANSQDSVSTNSTDVTVQVDFSLNFTSGDVAFVNANKTSIWTYANGTTVDVSVLISEVDFTATAAATEGLVGSSDVSLNVEALVIRKLLVFNFMQDLPVYNVDSALTSIYWDPTTGTSDTTVMMGSKAAFHASGSLVLIAFTSLIALYLGRRL